MPPISTTVSENNQNSSFFIFMTPSPTLIVIHVMKVVKTLIIYHHKTVQKNQPGSKFGDYGNTCQVILVQWVQIDCTEGNLSETDCDHDTERVGLRVMWIPEVTLHIQLCLATTHSPVGAWITAGAAPTRRIIWARAVPAILTAWQV